MYQYVYDTSCLFKIYASNSYTYIYNIYTIRATVVSQDYQKFKLLKL